MGHTGAYNRTAYCASKFAVEGFTKAAAMDLGKYGIRINTIAPTKTIVNEKELILTNVFGLLTSITQNKSKNCENFEFY